MDVGRKGKACCAQAFFSTKFSRRELHLAVPNGGNIAVLADDHVGNFDLIQVDDTIATRFTQALVLEVRKGGSGIRERVAPLSLEATKDAEQIKPIEKDDQVEGGYAEAVAIAVKPIAAKKVA